MSLVVEEKITNGQKSRQDTLIFPRYHQLDAVRKLLVAAKTGGVGITTLSSTLPGRGRATRSHGSRTVWQACMMLLTG